MKIETTQDLRESFKFGYEEYYASRIEADEVWNLYHNRQWTIDQIAKLDNRGQPKETFNVIKLFARMLVGYYSTIVNTAIANPQQYNDITMATMATDLIKSVLEKNYFVTEGDKLKLSAIIAGIMICYIAPKFTGKYDKFGRPLYTIKVDMVPDHEIVTDPMSTKDDYSDARWLHRFKWVPEEFIVQTWGRKALERLDAYYNHLQVAEAEFHYSHANLYTNRYRVFDNYLLVHSVVVDDNNKRWSIYWCGEVMLEKKEITFKKVKWHYRVVKTHDTNKVEYYGIFREVVETQKAINQALVKLQLMINSQKVFVEKNGAVDNIEDFTAAVNRVTGVIPVIKLTGIKVVDMSKEALELYTVIDKAFDRIQRILNINDSFLGMAFASDSGRKVKLQKNATIMALRYLTERIELMYRLIGEDILGLATQFMKANQVLRITDEITGNRFIELNKPMEIFTGQFDQDQQPIMQNLFEQILDPESNKPLEVDGNLVFAPIPEDGTELNFDEMDITIQSSAFHDEDEKAQLMVETVLSGTIGQMMSQVNPAGFFKIAGLTMRTMKTKFSPEISKVFEDTAALLQGDPEEEAIAGQIAQNVGSSGNQPKSASLKLPEGG